MEKKKCQNPFPAFKTKKSFFSYPPSRGGLSPLKKITFFSASLKVTNKELSYKQHEYGSVHLIFGSGFV